MTLPNFGSHNKVVYMALLLGAVGLGIYLRRKSSGADSSVTPTDTTTDGSSSGYVPDDSGSGAEVIQGPPGKAGARGKPGKRGPRGKPGTPPKHHPKTHKHPRNGSSASHHSAREHAPR